MPFKYGMHFSFFAVMLFSNPYALTKIAVGIFKIVFFCTSAFSWENRTSLELLKKAFGWKISQYVYMRYSCLSTLHRRYYICIVLALWISELKNSSNPSFFVVPSGWEISNRRPGNNGAKVRGVIGGRNLVSRWYTH